MRFIVSAFLVVACLLFLGCSKKAPTQRDLHVNLYCEPNSLDPRAATDLTSCNVLCMLFEGLMRIDNDHLPKPACAKQVRISENGRVYTFTLKQSVWSDGSPVTAHDFVYAWQSLLAPSFPAAMSYKLFIIENAKEIKEGKAPPSTLGVKALNDTTLQVTLKHPAPYFLELLAFPTFFPVKANIDDEHPQWSQSAGSHYISNGPFTLDTWEHENEIKVKKSTTYWDKKSVSLPGIHLVMINDTMTEYYMYEGGQLDIAGSPISNLPFEVLKELKERGDLLQEPIAGVYYFKINTEVAPFNNKKIRQAFAYCINRQEIVEHVLQLPHLIATGAVPPLSTREQPRSCFKDGQLTQAKRLFEEGLKEEGLTLRDFPEVTFLYNTNREHKRIAEALAYQWGEGLGVKVALKHADWNTYLGMVQHKQFTIARAGWIGDMNDPIAFLTPYRQIDDPNWGGNNNTGWENQTFQELLLASEKALSQEERFETLNQAEELLMEEMPFIPLHYITAFHVIKPYVEGIFYSRLGIVDFKKARLL